MAIDQRMRIRMGALLRLSTFIVCLGAIYAVAQALHWRSDWTEDQVATLSESSRALLRQLDEPLMIRAYITSGMPQPYAQLQRYIEDLLRSVHEAGGGNIGYEVLDPADDPNIAASLAAMQVPKVQVQVIEDDQAQVKQGYLAIVIEFLDKKEIIPVVQSEQGLEYTLMRKIRKLTGKGRGKLAVTTGFGAPDIADMRRFSQSVSEDYEVVSFDPEKEDVPEGTRVILVPGLRKPPSGAWRYRLEQFRLRGGGLLVLAGNVWPDMRYGFQVVQVDPYTNDWLREDLHVSVEPGLVMDQQAARITISQRQGIFTFRSAVDYPFIPDVTDIDRQHPITAGVDALSLPFPSPLAPSDGQTADVLLRSSSYASVQQGPPFDVDPRRSIRERFRGLRLQSSSLALAYDGPQKAHFTQPPEGVKLQEGEESQQHGNGRWVVIGSLSLLDDQFLQADNIVPVLNTIDWLAGDEGLIALRSRGVTHRPLVKLDSSERMFYKTLWMLGLPLLLLTLGLARWWWLRHGRRRVEA